MRQVGRLAIAGPQAWPDHLLDVNRRRMAGLVVAGGRCALGFECSGLRYGYVYLVWWCFELSWDTEAW